MIDPNRSILLRNATLLTCDDVEPDRIRGDLRITGGKISEIGDHLEPTPTDQIIELDGHIVAPGLVDAHQHVWEEQHALQHPDLSFKKYFSDFVRPAAQEVTAADLGHIVEKALATALSCGTTTTFDWCHLTNTADHALASIAAANSSGARYIFGYGPPVLHGYYHGEMPHPIEMEQVVGEWRRNPQPRVSVAAALRGPDLSPLQTCLSDIARARALNIPISIHVGTRAAGPGGISALAREGVLGPDLQVIHATNSSDDELQLLAEHDVRVVVPTLAEIVMATGNPPLRALADRGIVTGLGIDTVVGVPSDMFSQMRSAFQILRAAAWEENNPPRGSTCREVMVAATLGGARSCWLDDATGSLAVGKAADLMILGPSRAPVTIDHAYAEVVWNGHASLIRSVFVDGEELRGTLSNPESATFQGT